MPLGVLRDAVFEEETLLLQPGGRVLIYTDGLTETQGVEGEFFGQEQLESWLKKEVEGASGAQVMKENLIQVLHSFQGNPALVDDQTFVILGR